MADINVKLLQGTEAKMSGNQAPAIKNGQLYFATIDEGTKGYIYLDSNGKRFSFGKYAETAGYATEAGAAENAKRAGSADIAGRLQIPILTNNILTTAVSQPAGTSALYFVGSNAITAVGSPANNSFIKIYKDENNNVLIDCYEALNGNHWINSNPNATSATSGWTGWVDLSVKEAAKHWETPVTFQITDGVNDGVGIAVDGSQSPIKLPLPNIIKATLNGNADSATHAGKLTTARKFTIGNTGKDFNGENPLTWTSSEIGYRHEWQATIHGQVWSRLCYIENHTPTSMSAILGNSFILNIAATRGSVVYNDTFLIKTHHQGAAASRGKIIKISGSEYSTGYSLRLLTNSNGVCYVELKDSLNSIANGTSQGVVCRLIPFYTGKITTYTAFTSGATLPSGFEVTQEMITTGADIQAYVEGSFKGNLDGNATSATTASSAAKVNHTLSTNTQYSLSGTTLTASGASDIVFDTGIYTDTTPGHLVVTGGIDNTGDLKQADGHIYLTGAQPASDTGSTTQIVFGTPSDQHVVLSSNKKLLVINPTTSTATNQILFYLDQASKIPSGLQVGSAITPIATGQTSLGTTSLKFSSLHLSGDANIGGGASVGGNLTVTNKTTLNGVLDVVGASTFTGLITANGGVKGNVTGNLTGNADTATEADKAKKWSATKAFKVADNSGENAGAAVNVDGTANVTLRMPLTFKGNHTIDGNLSISGDTSTSGNVTLNGSGKTFTSNIDNKFIKHIQGNISALHSSTMAGFNTTNNLAGYHLISITPTTSWMLAFTVRLYQGYHYTDIVISGYNYSTDQTWYSPKAKMIGSTSTSSIDVVFGCSATNKLWVAIPANSYYGIDIFNVTNGYTQITDYTNLFTITRVTTLPTSTPKSAITITAQPPWYRGEIVSTENGGTGNNAFTANRLLYSESATKLSSSGHYSSTNKVAINSTEIDEALTFYVNGNSKISGELNTTGNVDFDNNLNVDRLITQGGPTANTSIDAMNKLKTDLFVEGSGVAPNAPTVPGFYLGKSSNDGNRHMDIVSGDNVSYIDFNKAAHATDFDFRIHANVSNGLVDFQWGSHSALTDKRLKINGLAEVTGKLTAAGKIIVPTTGGAWLSGKTTSNASIQISTTQTASSYHPILGVTTSGNHVFNLGGIDNKVGFYGYYASRTANGTDFSTSWDVSSGLLVHTAGARIEGSLTVSKTTDLEGTKNNSPALIVGGLATAAHLELDSDELQAKASGTSIAALYLNKDGGQVNIGAGGLNVVGNTILGDTNADNTTIYGHLYKKGDSTNKGHIYLDGAASASTNNTTQIIFREGTTEHIALSSNNDCFVINPTSTSSSPQIALYLGASATSSIPGGLSLGKQLSVGTNATIGGTLQVNGTSTFTGQITANGGIVGALTGNATTCSYPLGFASRTTGATWGNTTGTSFTCWNDPSGGSIDFRQDNPSSGKLSVKVDGRFYVNEGNNPVLSSQYANGYWGICSPDGENNVWIRTTQNGIIPYQGGGHGSVGTSSWPFNAVYANNFYGNLTGNVTGSVTGNITGNAGGSAQTLANNSTANLSGCLQYFQSSTQTSGNDMPSAAWHHVIKMNHGTGDSYYKRLLAFDFFSNTIKTTYKNGESTDHTTRWVSLWKEGDSVTGAVWNDYAECRESDTEDFGYVLTEVGDDSLTKTTERLQHFAGVSSDTWGFSQGETEKAKTPIAVAGRVLVYPYQDRNNYKPGDCVCAAAGGTVDIMTREEIMYYPDRIVGTVSCVPEYEEWGGGEIADRPPVKVNGRIWIKVR